MSEHTPGPWYVKPSFYEDGPATVYSDLLDIALIHSKKEDAELIADAPRLFDENRSLKEANQKLQVMQSRASQAHELLRAWVIEDTDNCGNTVDWAKIRQAKELLHEVLEDAED